MPVQTNTPVEALQRSLGRRIRELRRKHGWSQEQFAEFCGLHRTYMGHVERGEKNVSLSTVVRVANALGVRISALLGRAQAAHEEPPKPALEAGPASGPPVEPGDVNRLLAELRAQRKAMRQSLRNLSGFLIRLSESIAAGGKKA